MPKVFQVIATRRDDMSDHCIAMRSTDEAATALAGEYAEALKADHIRCFVRASNMTHGEITAIVTHWGREDAAKGESRKGTAGWPETWARAYRNGFDSVNPVTGQGRA